MAKKKMNEEQICMADLSDGREGTACDGCDEPCEYATCFLDEENKPVGLCASCADQDERVPLSRGCQKRTPLFPA